MGFGQHIPALKDAKKSPDYGQPSKRCTCGMATQDKSPYHDINPQIDTKARDVLCKVLCRKFSHQEAYKTGQLQCPL